MDLTNTEQKSTRGGYRPGAGRHTTDRSVPLSVRISQEGAEMIKQVRNKSQYIDQLIKNDNEQK